MKDAIKSIFNLKTILGCYIGAIGYGVGYNLPNTFGLHPLICLASCLILGTVFDRLSNKILSTKFFNKSKKNKWLVAGAIYIGYLIAWAIVDYALDYDLDYDFLSNVVLIIGIQVVLLIINMIRNNKKAKKEETTNK